MNYVVSCKRLVFSMCLLLVTGGVLSAVGAIEEESAAVPERHVWWWGIASRAGTFQEEQLVTANQWLKERFGFTLHLESGIPTDATREQALQLIIAQGQFPDVMVWLPFETVADLAAEGRLLALDKYFDDPADYPIYASADRQYLGRYLVNGRQYGIPAFGWVIRKDDNAWIPQMWIIRNDIYEAYGGYPRTTTELYDLLKRVQADRVPDLEDNPSIPFGLQPARGGATLPDLKLLIESMLGAGWEVDSEKRLMPRWASQEYYEAMKFINRLWREGLMSPGLFAMSTGKFQEDLMTARYAVSAGATWIVAPMRDTIIRETADRLREEIPEVTNEKIRNHPDITKLLPFQYLMLVNPVLDDPGRITLNQPPPTILSRDTPNPDGVVSYLHWLLTDEGVISVFWDAGYLGTHWEWAPEPLLWRLKPGVRPERQHDQDTGEQIAHHWKSAGDLARLGLQPLVPPAIATFAHPAYSIKTYGSKKRLDLRWG